MKKYISSIMTLLLTVFVIASCAGEPENWVVINSVQPGFYVAGDATIYSATASASTFVEAGVDAGGDEVKEADWNANIGSIITWCKSGGSLNITKVDEKGNSEQYGKGEAVDATAKYVTYNLVKDASFTIEKAGLYKIVLNKKDNQLTLIPIELGIIGDATPGSWGAETSMGEAVYNEGTSTVTFTLANVALDKKQIKFRYTGDWGFSFPYDGVTAKIHTNLGSTTDKDGLMLTEAAASLSAGGKNFAIEKKGTYTLTASINLRSGSFTAAAKLTSSSEVEEAELPTTMFINGSPYSDDWAWNKAYAMIPVNQQVGRFWAIQYYEAGTTLKFNRTMDWDGNEFGAASEDANEFGLVAEGKENLKVKNAGYYLIIITSTLSDDKLSVKHKIELLSPEVYLIGATAPVSDWTEDAGSNLFTLSAEQFESPAIAADGAVRMYVNVEDADWWATEFNVINDKITYRGNGGDQPAVNVTVGQIVKLNFKTGIGVIE